MDLTIVFKLFILLIVALIATVLLPYIKEKLGAEKYKKIETWTRTAVEAAELIYYKSGMGPEKKAYVEAYLNDLFEKYHISITVAELNAFIEAAVMELKLKEKA